MSLTGSRRGLLQACVQDLHAARRVAALTLPKLAEDAGEELAAQLRNLAASYAEEAGRFEQAGLPLDGPANLWMAGIMEDGERDARTIARGALLDTALIGAVRKGVAADIVSLETAIAVARAEGENTIVSLAEELHTRGRAADGALRDLLARIA